MITRIIDNDGDMWLPFDGGLFHCASRPHMNLEPREREDIESVFGIRGVIEDQPKAPVSALEVVWLVTSKDSSDRTSIIAARGLEENARALVQALVDADTQCAYTYEVVRLGVVR